MGLNKAPAGSNMQVVRRVFAGLAVIFMLLFFGRLVYSLTTHNDRPRIQGGYDYDFGLSGLLGLSGKVEPKNIAGGPDRKYESIVKLTVRSMQFDADMAKARAAIAARGGLVQLEDSGGLPGERKAVLKIGVPPEAFDALREDLAKLGQITGMEATVKDLTQEYRQLLAEEERLAQRPERPNTIVEDPEERRALDDMIYSMLQNVRARLDDYSGERDLCTVDFTLYEGSLINMGKEAWDALTWSAGVFAAGAGIALLAALLSLAVAALWTHMKHLGQKAGEQ